MVLIKVDDEIGVQSLFRVSELVIILHLYRKENPDTLAIVVIDQELLCVCVVDEPLQQFYTGEHGVLLATMCRYDSLIFGKTSSSSFLMSGSLWGIFWEFFLD
jgi:hypothetical protein